MLAAVKGYYDGRQIVIDEADRKNLTTGDEVVITVLDRAGRGRLETREDKRKRIIKSGMYVTPTGRTAEEIERYMKEIRDDRE